jgi:hypothetical protein
MFFEGPMATPIRPNFQTPQPQATQRPDAARSAAQRAFFNAALGNTTAPSAPQAQPSVQFSAEPARPTQKIPTSLPTEPPTRIMRPGSFLDIKV